MCHCWALFPLVSLPHFQKGLVAQKVPYVAMPDCPICLFWVCVCVCVCVCVRGRVCVCVQSADVCEQILRVVSRSARLEELVLDNAGLKT